MKKLSLLLFMFLFTVSAAVAQRTVSGTVLDDTGLSLIGANVLVENSTTGTITDIDGNFSLEVPEGTEALVISYTGYTTKTVSIAGQDRVNITMSEGELLDEIVVTAGGLEKNKARLGYAIQNIKSDEVVGAKEVNLVDALNSKVAGVSVVSSSGSPGASSNIRIRGNTSINGSNEPLFVVDGVPIDNSSFGNGTDGVDQSNRAIDLNPNDIESLTILKGPSATALYGVRAANGAIVVTTKKGSSGKPKVTISASYGLDRVNKLPARQNTYAQGRVTEGVASYLGPASSNGFSWGPLISDLEFDGSDDPFDQNGTLVPAGTTPGATPARAYDPYTFFVDGTTYDFNASVSGGTDDVKYYISAGNLTQNGIVPNSTFARTSFRVNTSAQISEKLNIGASAAYSNTGGSRIQRGSNLNGVMLGLLRTSPTFDNGNGLEGYAAADSESTYVQANGDQRSYRNGIYDNPYWTVNRNPSNDDVNRIIGNINTSYAITDELTLGYRLGIDNYSDSRLSGFDIQTNAFRPVVGSVRQTSINKTDLNSDLTLMYSTSLSESIGLSALVGYNAFDTNRSWVQTDGSELSVPGFFHITNATNLESDEAVSRKRIHGLYGTADVSFEDYLFLNLTARQDWSSTLPVDNNTYQSYSASVGFAFTEAMQLKSSLLDYGKLRLSFGVVGNDAPVFSTLPVFLSAEADGDGFISEITFPNYGVNSFARDVTLANPLLTPEKTTTFEVGGEFKFLKGRLGLDVTYYDSTSDDVIIDADISPTTGYTNITQNSAVITNSGIELVLDGTPVRNGNFSWDVAVNFTQMENDVESLADGIEDIGLAGFTSTSADVVAGLPFSVIYGAGWQRNDNGDIIVGADGWPLVDPVRKAIGDPNPDWTAGIRNTLTFGNISVSGLLDIRSGGDMWCGTCGIMDYFGTSEQSATERNDVVVFDGVQGNAEDGFTENTTAVALGSADPNASFSSFYRVRYGFGGITEMNVYDTSWLRLRELTVAYNIGADMLGGIFNGGSLALTGRNLWLSTDYPGIDPETNLTGDSNGYGLDYFNMPNTKSFNATLRLNF